MTKYRTKRRMVMCLKCGHEWMSHAERPNCSECGSYQVLNTKDAPEKYDILKLRADTNRRLNEFSQEITETRLDIKQLVNGLNYLHGEITKSQKELSELKMLEG